MPFTDEERGTWREQKRASEHREQVIWRPAPAAVYVNCQNSFGVSESIITDEVALCDICSGD